MSAPELRAPAALAGKAATAMRLLREEGVGSVRDRVVEQVKPKVLLNESHVWYRRDLTQPAAARPLPEGTRLVPLGEDNLDLLEQLPTIGLDEARRRLADGDAGWAVEENGQALFACWLFRTSAPVIAAAGGRLTLAPGVLMLEDSVTAEAARGRGVAPAAWSLLISRSADEGFATMITKVAVSNVPSRKAVIKAGFVASGIVEFRRVGRRSRTALHPTEISDISTWLATALPAESPFLESRGTVLL